MNGMYNYKMFVYFGIYSLLREAFSKRIWVSPCSSFQQQNDEHLAFQNLLNEFPVQIFFISSVKDSCLSKNSLS